MPRFTVHVWGEWLTIPCKDASKTIRWLGMEALSRYKSTPNNVGFDNAEDVTFSLRRHKNLSLLSLDDIIEDVLENEEFVEVVLNDVTCPNVALSQAEGGFLYSKYVAPKEYIYVDGESMTTQDICNLGKGLYKIKLSPEAEAKVKQSRLLIENIIQSEKVVYGINTGFGKFARTVIHKSKLKELQENLIRSHSAGVGNPLSPEHVRMLFALRINVLAKGYSGISLETLQQVIDAFNASCLPYVPEKGTVGASGDLAPLSHLALGLLGEGKMWSPKSGWADAKYVLEAYGLKPLSLLPKEGLALINGTQLITSLGCEAVERAIRIAKQADIVAAFAATRDTGSGPGYSGVKCPCHGANPVAPVLVG